MEEINTQEINIDHLLQVSSSPHIHGKDDVQRIMLDVVIALIPATIAGIYFFGKNAAMLMVIAIASAVISEALFQKIRKQRVTISDLSAVVTGILVGMNMPPGAAWYAPLFGSFFAIVVAKQLFGGLGFNWANPALTARAVLLLSWPEQMMAYIEPLTDTVTTATPLNTGAFPQITDMLLGLMPGSIGEVSAIALILAGVYLLIRKVIHIRIPAIYIGGVAVFLLLFGVPLELILPNILAGGLLLAAFFMATDYSTTPLSNKGQIVFALGAAFITALIRTKGGMAEGAAFAILLMNVCTPLINKYTAPKVFGSVD